MLKNKIRLTSIILAIILSFSYIVGNVHIVNANNNTEIDKIKEQYKELEKQQKELKESLNKTAQEKKQTAEYQKQLEQQISVLDQQIGILNDQIQELNNQILAKQNLIEIKKVEIKENYEKFKVRLRAMYMNNDTSVLNTLLGSNSFSDFLSRTETLKRISEHDKELVDLLNKEKKDLEDAVAAVEASKKELEVSKAQLGEKQSEFNTAYSQTASVISQLSELEKQFNGDKSKIEAQMKKSEEDIDRLLAQNSGSDVIYTGEGFVWPVPGYNVISSGFDYRPSPGAGIPGGFHKGIDIPAPRGTNVIASSGGKVISGNAQHSGASDPGGYGKYVVIDHGGGYMSLYGHNSAILAQPGQRVKQGDVIAKIGSTGGSTGNHVHFEVRVNNVPQNPLNYVKRP